MKSAFAIVLGVAFCHLMYSDSLREYAAKGDDKGVEVTIVAIFGSFLPFLGGAIIMLGSF